MAHAAMRAMVRFAICGLGLAGLLVALPQAAAAKPDMALLQAREGVAALMRGQYAKAVTSLNQALAQPDLADFVKASIYSDLGVAKWRQRQLKPAIEDFNKSIALSPDDATVYNNRGNALLDFDQPQEALKDFDRAVALSPNYGVAFNNRGNAHMELQQYSAAFQDFVKAVQLMPTSAVALNGRAKAHAALKRYHAAIRDETKALAINLRCENCYANRGEAYLAIDKYGAAASDFSQALKIDPNQANLFLLRAKAYAGGKHYRRAQADLSKALSLKPDFAPAYIERGRLLTTLGRGQGAITALDRAIAIAPSAKAYALRAEAKLKSKDTDGALADAVHAIQLSPQDGFALKVRGDVYLALDRQDDAVADYRKALKYNPFEEQARQALIALNEPVPPAAGPPLGPPVMGWVIHEVEPSRYMATDPDYPSIQAPLEMFGAGKPKVLQWTVLQRALSGIGLLRYYAGDLSSDDPESSLVYVAIIDLRAGKVLATEPFQWGDKQAQWNWGGLTVAVTDPDGNTDQVRLRKPPPPPKPAKPARPRPFRHGFFNWLFH